MCIYVHIGMCTCISIYTYNHLYNMDIQIYRCKGVQPPQFVSGGRLCTLIGVPWRGVGFSTLSTGRCVLKQHICKGAESAEHADTSGYTYEGTPTTA